MLVVGLGPGGGSAARRAAELGRSVIGVERNQTVGAPVQCAEFIPRPLRPYALAPGVAVQEVTGMHTYLPSGSLTRTPFQGFIVDRSKFDRAISERARAAGAELLCGSCLVDLDSTAGLAMVRSGTKELSVRYRVLIAADGPQSATARLLGLPPLEVLYTRQYTVPLLRPSRDTVVWLADDFPGGYAWLFPRGGEANLGLGADKRFERDLKEPLERLHRRLVSAGIVGSHVRYRTGGVVPTSGMRKKLVVDRVLFVGDAAGLTHPITGAGIAAAVISGERGGQAAADYCRTGAEQELMDFEEDLRDHFQASLERAVEQRRRLSTCWRTPTAWDDRVMRSGWIAFPEYFS